MVTNQIQLQPPGDFNAVVNKGQHVKNLMLAMIDRCQNAQ